MKKLRLKDLKLRLKKNLVVIILISIGIVSGLSAQNGVKDEDPKNDIMMQTFGWNEHEQSRITSGGGFYTFYNDQATYLSEAGIDMMWFPPPSQSTGGVGYIPTKIFNFSYTSYGSEAEMTTMLNSYNNLGMFPIADIVVNHRGTASGWTDFEEPSWGCEAICGNDDGGWTAQNTSCSLGADDTGDDFSGARDLNHQSTTVQDGVKEFLDKLKAFGYQGWRWDVAKGFSAYYFGLYNNHSNPYYSVGEYWDGNSTTLKNWIDGTDGTSGAFDFSNYYKLNVAVKWDSYGELNSGGKMYGLAGQMGYDDKAVTFVDNHDTFVHTDAILGDNVLKAYAYILTHPGIPCVWAPHYYGGSYWKDEVNRVYDNNETEINKLMGVRKQNGINAYSSIDIQEAGSGYAAYVSASYGSDAVVAVRVGNSSWEPAGSGWILNASGIGYSVWSKKTISIPAGVPVNISLIGSGVSDWGTDVAMTSSDNENYTLSNYVFAGGGVKFRANSAWALNWGGTEFPDGTGVTGSDDNIPVVAGTYDVTFNRTTSTYNFELIGEPCVCPENYEPVCANDVTYSNSCEAECAGFTTYTQGVCTIVGNFAEIGIIGPATSTNTTVQWATDVDMTTTDGYIYTLNYDFFDGEAKFREDNDWTTNWGATDFPSGTGLQDGDNVDVIEGNYDVTFNRTTGEYSFVSTNNPPVGIEAVNIQSTSVSPNPTTNSWMLKSNVQIESVELIDISGKLIYSSLVNSNNVTIEGKDLSGGLYFAIVKSANSIETIKLTKK